MTAVVQEHEGIKSFLICKTLTTNMTEALLRHLSCRLGGPSSA